MYSDTVIPLFGGIRQARGLNHKPVMTKKSAMNIRSVILQLKPPILENPFENLNNRKAFKITKLSAFELYFLCFS